MYKEIKYIFIDASSQEAPDHKMRQTCPNLILNDRFRKLFWQSLHNLLFVTIREEITQGRYL